jgi:diguanylate cyclase (GGDEF)-like protein/PAS domain S-box-containing protein
MTDFTDTSFDDIFQSHPLPMWVYDPATLAILAVNDAALVQYGYTRAEFLRLTLADLRPPEDLPRLYDALDGLEQGPRRHARLWRHKRKDGVLLDVEVYSHSIRYLGRAARFVVVMDMSARLAAERRIACLNRIYAMFSSVSAAIVELRDREALFAEACRIATAEGGLRAARVDSVHADGQLLRPLVQRGEPVQEGRTDLESGWPAARALREQRPVVINDVAREPALAAHAACLRAAGVGALAAYPLMAGGRVVAVLTLFADSPGVFDQGEQKVLRQLVDDLGFALSFIEREEALSHLAFHDALTGLPNRKLYMDRLSRLLLAGPGTQAAVALFNLEGLERINQVHGRACGDQLLRQAAARMAAALPDSASLARLGGDSFALALPNLARTEDAVELLQRGLFEPLDTPFTIDGQRLQVTARAGLALFPLDGADAELLVRHARSALQGAARAHKRYLFFSRPMNAAMEARLRLEHQLQAAVAERQFELVYQPRVSIPFGHVTSAEALIRWRHPKGEMIGPVEFIPLAEETGLIYSIGAWVIEAVCAQQARWLADDEPVVPVAINLSAVQSSHGDLLRDLRRPIERHGLPADLIEFELTESAVMQSPDEAVTNLSALKGFGVHLSLDDFGTGYSSLAQLKRFPFDFVKIDRSFVLGLDTSAEDEAIAAAIIAMAHSLQLEVVAEGVETRNQLTMLRCLDCDEMQGYLFSQPLPPERFMALVRRGTRLEHA